MSAPRPLKHPRWRYDESGHVRSADGKYPPYSVGPDGRPRVVAR